MKTAIAALLLALALSSPAQAILRPRFPHRTLPPASGNFIFGLGQDSLQKAPMARPSIPR